MIFGVHIMNCHQGCELHMKSKIKVVIAKLQDLSCSIENVSEEVRCIAEELTLALASQCEPKPKRKRKSA